MVYYGKPFIKMDDLGSTPIFGNIHVLKKNKFLRGLPPPDKVKKGG